MKPGVTAVSELYIALKKALDCNKEFEFTPSEFERKFIFKCLPDDHLFHKKGFTINNPKKWYRYLKQKGLKECAVLIQHEKNKELIGLRYDDATFKAIICYFDDGTISWFPVYYKDDEKYDRTIIVEEGIWDEGEPSKFSYYDVGQLFLYYLDEIKEWSENYGVNIDLSMLDHARVWLDHQFIISNEKHFKFLNGLPEKNIRYYMAAFEAYRLIDDEAWIEVAGEIAERASKRGEFGELLNDFLKIIAGMIEYAIHEW